MTKAQPINPRAVIVSFKTRKPIITVEIGSNIPKMDVTVGPTFFTATGIMELAPTDTHMAIKNMKNQPLGVMASVKWEVSKP